MLKTFFKVFNSDDHLSREHEIPYVLDCDFHSFVFTCLDLSEEFFWQLAINYAEARKKVADSEGSETKQSLGKIS